jgi:hypothetical protein
MFPMANTGFFKRQGGGGIAYARNNGVNFASSNNGEAIVGNVNINSIAYDATAAFTINCIFQIDGSGSSTGYNYIFSGTQLGGTANRVFVVSYNNSTNKLVAFVGFGTGFDFTMSSTSNYSTGTIYQLTITKSAGTGLASEWKMYINGVDDATAVKSGNATTSGSINGPTHIGCRDDITAGSSRKMYGTIWDIIYFDSELSSADVASMVGGTIPTAPYATLRSWWKLDQVSGTNAPDVTSGNDATLQNFGARTNPGGGAWVDSSGTPIP